MANNHKCTSYKRSQIIFGQIMCMKVNTKEGIRIRCNYHMFQSIYKMRQLPLTSFSLVSCFLVKVIWILMSVNNKKREKRFPISILFYINRTSANRLYTSILSHQHVIFLINYYQISELLLYQTNGIETNNVLKCFICIKVSTRIARKITL